MKFLIILVLTLVSVQTFATGLKCVELIRNWQFDKNDIDDVKLVASIIKIDRAINYDNRSLVLTFEVSTSGGYGNVVEALEIVNSQASTSSRLNPSEFFIKTKVIPPQGAVMLVHMPGEKVLFEFKILLDQRLIAEEAKPWPAYKDTRFTPVYHFNFDAGMMKGYNRWRIYKLDFSNPQNPQFDFVKLYSLIEGQAVTTKSDHSW